MFIPFDRDDALKDDQIKSSVKRLTDCRCFCYFNEDFSPDNLTVVYLLGHCDVGMTALVARDDIFATADYIALRLLPDQIQGCVQLRKVFVIACHGALCGSETRFISELKACMKMRLQHLQASHLKIAIHGCEGLAFVESGGKIRQRKEGMKREAAFRDESEGPDVTIIPPTQPFGSRQDRVCDFGAAGHKEKSSWF